LKMLFAEYDVRIDFLNSKKETCLHVAVDQGDKKMVSFLLEQNPALINLKDDLGQTVLHRAYRWEFLRNILLDKGADSSITDNKGLTPLALYEQKNEEKKDKERKMREACRSSIHTSRNW
jgi:ankyrin repeat protein